MRMSVKRVKNGMILTDEEGDEIVFQETDQGECSQWADFLYYLTSEYGPSGSKYDKDRVYVNIAPGYGNELWDEIICPLCDRLPTIEHG